MVLVGTYARIRWSMSDVDYLGGRTLEAEYGVAATRADGAMQKMTWSCTVCLAL